MKTNKKYSVVVIGGGHAGVEAACAAARVGVNVALITHKIDKIGEMSCNPAIGGLGKGHLVREIDALDGVMAKAIDKGGIQFRILNESRGAAVRGPRAQADRDLYKKAILQIVKNQENIDLIEGSVNALPKRQINSETCKKFNYETGIYNGRNCHISNYYDKQYSLVAQHIRFADKSFKWLGDTDKISLFGQNLWRDGGKSIIITEGEIDAMSVSQINNHKYPVVSVPSGASSAKKYIKRELEWLSKFQKIAPLFLNRFLCSIGE